MSSKYFYVLSGLAGIGITDATYLTYEHYAGKIPPCTTHILFADCGKVLSSSYATIFNIPVAAFGILFYGLLLTSVYVCFKIGYRRFFNNLLVLSMAGLLASSYFVYLQLFVIKAICFYCMISAIDSGIIFIIIHYIYRSKLQVLKIYET